MKQNLLPATQPAMARRTIINERGEGAVFSPELKALLEGSGKPTQAERPEPSPEATPSVRFNYD
jgi:hypothetical protein